MRFFILCPAHIATGGTELVHQFSKCLSDRNIENYIIYDWLPVNQSAPTPERFQGYGAKYVRHYVDSEDSILVLPETRINCLNICKKGQIMIWWMSVDNYLLGINENVADPDVFALKHRNNVTNFWQSLYAEDFLKKKMGFFYSMRLMDYINSEIVEIGRLLRHKFKRENICLYNPSKGYKNLLPVIKRCQRCRSDIRWIAIKGLSPQEMALLFCHAKVYIDFGNHPGKDRIPREAAVCGVAVITNTIGSAGYDDIAIPDKYKVQDMQDVEHTLDIIYDLIDHFDDHKANFEEYIEIIENEKKQFDKDIENAVKYYEEKLGNTNITHKNDYDHSEIITSAESILSTLRNNFKEMRSPKDNHGLSEGLSLNKVIESDYLMNLLHEAIWAIEDDLTK